MGEQTKSELSSKDSKNLSLVSEKELPHRVYLQLKSPHINTLSLLNKNFKSSSSKGLEGEQYKFIISTGPDWVWIKTEMPSTLLNLKVGGYL